MIHINVNNMTGDVTYLPNIYRYMLIHVHIYMLVKIIYMLLNILSSLNDIAIYFSLFFTLMVFYLIQPHLRVVINPTL